VGIKPELTPSKGLGKNRYAGLRRILVRMQGAFASAYWWICAGGCNAADGPKDKSGGVFIFCRGHNILLILPQRKSKFLSPVEGTGVIVDTEEKGKG
jgi:hypothetical protein